MSSPIQPLGIVVGSLGGADDDGSGAPALLAGLPPLLAGLPPMLRAVLELQRAGAARIIMLVHDEALARAYSEDARVVAEVVVRSPASWATLAEVASGHAAVVVPAAAVAQRDVFVALHDAARSGRPTHARPHNGGLGPFVLTPKVTGSIAKAGGSARGAGSARAVVEQLEPLDAGWVIRADDDAGRKRIVHALFEGCRKSVDGIVSRHLNRHVSIFVSKRIVNTSLSPNVITVLTLFLGVAAGLATARATYGWMLAGAALLQLNSILDGVDGELARVRFQHSKLGQWLDTVCDDLANAMFYAGTAYAAFQVPDLPTWLPWCGVVAVVASLLTMVMYYAELIRLGVGDFYALDVGQDVPRTGLWGALDRIVRYIAKRDFFVFGFLVAAVFGVLPYMLVIMLIGTVITVVTGLKITWARLRSAD